MLEGKTFNSDSFYNRQYISRKITSENQLLAFDNSKTANIEVIGMDIDVSSYFWPAATSLIATDCPTVRVSSPQVGSVELSGDMRSLDISNVEALPALSLANASAEELNLYNCAGMTSVALSNHVKKLNVSDMPALKTLSGCDSATSAWVTSCPLIESLSFAGIEEFGKDAFMYNTNLKEVYFGDKLREHGNDGVFSGCKNLQDLVYGGTIEQWLAINRRIDESSSSSAMLSKVPNFWYGHGNAKLTKLTELNSTLVGNAEMITAGAFTAYKGLTKVSLPATVKHICNSAFAYCTALEEVDINPEIIEQYAFLGSQAITKLTLGNNLKYIGPAFSTSFTPGLTLDFLGTPDEWNKVFRTRLAYLDAHDPASDSGISYRGTCDIDAQELLFCGEPVIDVVFDKPERISTAFASCKSLQSVVINCGTGVTVIEPGAFMNCSSLKSVICKAQAARSADDNTTGLEIGENAFLFCYNLSEIGLLDNIKSIGPNAFLTTAWLRAQPQQQMLYLNTEHGLTAYTYVGDAPEGTHIDIEPGTKAINEGAFYSGNTSAGYKYTGITSVSLPESLTYIGAMAFEGTSLQGNFTIPKNVGYFGGSSCSGNTAIDMFRIEDSSEPLVSYEGFYAKISNVYFGRDLIGIDNYVGGISSRAISVESVTYGPLVTEVNSKNNLGCEVADIHVLATEPPVCTTYTNIWGTTYYEAFSSIDYSTCRLHVPAGSLDAYKAAPGWSEFANITGDASGINDVTVDNAVQPGARHYDIMGRTIDADARGLHIVVNPDGTSTKIRVE